MEKISIVILLDKLGTDGFSNVQIRGVPDNVMTFRPTVHIIEGRPPQPGTDEAIVGKAIAGRFKGLEIGQTFELRKNRPAKVVGIFADGGSSFESEVWADLQNVRSAFGREGLVSSVRVRLQSESKFDAFRTSIEQDPQLGLMVMRESEYYEKQSEGTSLFIKAMGIIIAVFFSFGAMIGVMITMHASVANRQKEIGTLRALGFSRLSILGCFLLQSRRPRPHRRRARHHRLADDGLRALLDDELRERVGDRLHLRADPGDSDPPVLAAAIMGLAGSFPGDPGCADEPHPGHAGVAPSAAQAPVDHPRRDAAPRHGEAVSCSGRELAEEDPLLVGQRRASAQVERLAAARHDDAPQGSMAIRHVENNARAQQILLQADLSAS